MANNGTAQWLHTSVTNPPDKQCSTSAYDSQCAQCPYSRYG